MDFNQNLTIFQTKETNFHNEFVRNHASKKYETIFCKEIIPSTFERCFHKKFWRRSRNDFHFLSCSMKFQQKSKIIEILMGVYRDFDGS